MDTKEGFMTPKDLAELMQVSDRTIHSWIKRFNNSKSEETSEYSEETSDLINIEEGKQTYLSINQVIGVIKIGKGEAVANLFADNYKNQKALVTVSDQNNSKAKELIETLLPSISLAIQNMIDAKIKPLQLTDNSKPIDKQSKKIDEVELRLSLIEDDIDAVLSKIDNVEQYTKATMIGKKVKILKKSNEPYPVSINYRKMIHKHICAYAEQKNMEVVKAYSKGYALFSSEFSELLINQYNLVSLFAVKEDQKIIDWLDQENLLEDFYSLIFVGLPLVSRF